MLQLGQGARLCESEAATLLQCMPCLGGAGAHMGSMHAAARQRCQAHKTRSACFTCAGSPCKTRKALASEAPRRRGRLALGACPATVCCRFGLPGFL